MLSGCPTCLSDNYIKVRLSKKYNLILFINQKKTLLLDISGISRTKVWGKNLEHFKILEENHSEERILYFSGVTFEEK